MGFRDKLKSIWQRLFGNSVQAFGIVSLLFLISLAIAPAKNYFSQWRYYQNGYLEVSHSATSFSGRCPADLVAGPGRC